jgi:hypothetical protein
MLAARNIESDVARALEQLLDRREPWDDTDVERLLEPDPIKVPQISPCQVELAQYDRLLAEAHYAS